MGMSDEQQAKCHAIIHAAATSAAGVAASMAQAPGTDNIPLVAIEVGMILSLGRVFRITITEAGAKSILGGFVGTHLGRGIFQFLGGWIPGAGNALNAFTAAGVVEAVGWAVAADFGNRRTPPSPR